MIAYNLVADTYGNEISLRRLMSVFTVENFFIKSPRDAKNIASLRCMNEHRSFPVYLRVSEKRPDTVF